MARADRRRSARAKSAAGPRAHARNVNQSQSAKQQSIEDTMFFVRIRRHAKWVFVFLALTFAVTFVVFGVGANNAGTASATSSRAAAPTASPRSPTRSIGSRRTPKDADARRDLATAYQADGRNSEAIAALDAYIVLRPKDQDALRELAGLHRPTRTSASRRPRTRRSERPI